MRLKGARYTDGLYIVQFYQKRESYIIDKLILEQSCEAYQKLTMIKFHSDLIQNNVKGW